MSKIFITGGLGYIGSKLAQEALLRGHSVMLYDSLIHGQDHKKILDKIILGGSGRCEFVIGDTRNTGLLEESIKKFKPDFLFHLAELSGIYAANHNPTLTEEINYKASKAVVDIAERLEIPLIYNSTSSLYGNQKEMRLMQEGDPLPPTTDNYCKYKLLMEEYIKNRKTDNQKFKIIVFRPATVCGISPRMRLELLPNQFVFSAISRRKIRISDSGAYRAAIDIDDLIDSYFAAMNNDLWPDLVYNIGHYNFSKKEFAEIIRFLVECEVVLVEGIGDTRNLQIDSGAFFKDFNFKPRYSYHDTVIKLIKWINDNIVEVERSNYAGYVGLPLDQWQKIV